MYAGLANDIHVNTAKFTLLIDPDIDYQWYNHTKQQLSRLIFY